MQVSSRPRASRAIVFTALVGALILSNLLLTGASAQTPAATSVEVTMGLMAPAGIADPLHPPTTPGIFPRVGTPNRVKGARPIPRSQRPDLTSTRVLPVVSSSDVLAPTTGQLVASFNGVSSLDSATTNFGAEFEPPDQGLCVGNGFVIDAVNSAFTIYHRDGSVVLGPLNLNVLFGEGLTEYTSDARCYFDPSTHTWFATVLFIDSTNTSARTDISVNSSGDPTTPWTVYHLDATDDGTNGTPSHRGCPCLGDQPLLGLDGQNLYVSTNEFSILGPQFDGTQIYAIAKSELIAKSSAHFAHFGKLQVGGTIAGAVQPAISSSSADAEYFLSSLDPTGTGDHRLGVWALTNRGAVVNGLAPTLSNLVITTEGYGIPPNVAQKGSTTLLSNDDDRMQQVQYIQGNIWGALGTAVTLAGDPTPRGGVAWFKVHPSLNGQQIASASLLGQGYVASSSGGLLYPAIEVSPTGTAALVMTLSGATIYPSAAYTTMASGQTKFGSIKIGGVGTGSYDPAAGRWGDYSAAAFDPSTGNIWMATEYVPPLASQTTDRRRNWGTRVFAVAP